MDQMEVVVNRTSDAAFVTINRPDTVNALSLAMSERISEVFRELREAPCPVVIGSAVPGAFVSGVDLSELRQRRRAEALARVNATLFGHIEEHPWPTIAAVDGPALGGGCELALACDFRIGTTRSMWGLPELRLGIIPSAGGLWRLPRLVGWARAVELVMTARRLDGAAAYQSGLTQRLCEPAVLDHEVRRLLDELSGVSMSALRLAKEAMRAPADHGRLVDAAAQALCYENSDTASRIDRAISRRGSRRGG